MKVKMNISHNKLFSDKGISKKKDYGSFNEQVSREAKEFIKDLSDIINEKDFANNSPSDDRHKPEKKKVYAGDR